LIRTIDQKCKPGGVLPDGGSATLLWPERKMKLYGISTRRLGVLYRLQESDVEACYIEDARTTYADDHSSHVTTVDLNTLRQRSKKVAGSDRPLMYNEVVLKKGVAVLGFALIMPWDGLDALEEGAKRIALQLCALHGGTTIVTWHEELGVLVE